MIAPGRKNGPAGPPPPRQVTTRRLEFVVVYNGPLDAGEEVIRPVREFGQPIVDEIGPMPYTGVQTMFDPLAPTGRHYYVKAPFLREIQVGAIEALVDGFAEFRHTQNIKPTV